MYLILSEVLDLDIYGISEKFCKRKTVENIDVDLSRFLYRKIGTHTYGKCESGFEVIDLAVTKLSILPLLRKLRRKKMRKLAPLVIFVYNRLSITQQMLEAINQNTLAPETEVFIYSDGPKNEDDFKKVLEVRRCIHNFAEISNFKKVEIIEADKNKGLANSIINGVTEVIQKFKRVIVLEDDLITAVNFLDFMNDCLDYYENNAKIWSIGGTTYKMDALDHYPHDVYVCYRGQSWGWATWIDRWIRVDWNVADYEAFMKDRKRKKLFKRGGQDMVEALKKQMEGKTDSWAIRWCYQESKEDMLTVLPSKSLIKNIGWDGSGTHCDVDRFHVEIDSEKYEYKLSNVEIDTMIMKDFRKYFSRSLIQRIMDYLYIKIRG